MKRICTILAGLAMVLTGTMAAAPSADAVIVQYPADCCSWFGDPQVGFGQQAPYPPTVMQCIHLVGHVSIWGWDRASDGKHIRVYYNKSWVSDGWVLGAKAVGNGITDVTSHMWDPPWDGYVIYRVELWNGSSFVTLITQITQQLNTC